MRSLHHLVLALALGSVACDRFLPQPADESLPGIEVIEQVYARHGVQAQFRYSGNVVELIVQQPSDQLVRGGQLWARVGPYVYLFSPATREVFEAYPGVAGARVITRVGVDEVARALLVRDRLNEFGWRRALSVLSNALEEGTARPTTLERLVRFGEEQTEYSYNPTYVPPRNAR